MDFRLPNLGEGIDAATVTGVLVKPGDAVRPGQPVVSVETDKAAMEVEAAKLTVYNAARLRDVGKPFLTEAAICKIFSSEVAERVSSLAVNLFGGNGFVKEYPVEKLFRDAKIMQLYEGTSQIQRLVIARETLLPRRVEEPTAVPA